MKRIGLFIIAALGILIAPASAQAILLVTPQGHLIGGKWQRWAHESKVPTPRIHIPLVLSIPQACGDVDGCIGGKPVAIHVLPTAHDARFALMHEVGHAFDELYLTHAERHRFEYLDGWGHGDHYGYRPWSVGGSDPPASPMEDFANTYASCAIWGDHPHQWWMNLWQGWDSDWASYRAACKLIKSVSV